MRLHSPVPLLLLIVAPATLALTLAAAGDGTLPGDVALSRAAQRLDAPGADAAYQLGYWIGSVPAITAIGVALSVLFVARGWSAAALLLLAATLVRNLNPVLKGVIESPRPTSDVVRVSEEASNYGFPSGHVMGVILVYGGIVYIAQTHIRRAWLRITIQTLALLVILITSFSRVYSGAHWPSDVLGAYLWGLLLLTLLLGGYQIVRLRRQRQPPARHG